jgi:YD repeat-containing protein
MTHNGFHHYTFDAEGNITAVDAGSTAQYVYDAFNHRVRTVVGSSATEFIFSASGIALRIGLRGLSDILERSG